MRNHMAAIVVAGVVLLAPVMVVAAASARQAKPAAKTTQTTPASHATTGVVKSISDTSMVIKRSPWKSGEVWKSGEMTFNLDSSTQREGTIAAGTSVSVRYRDEGGNHVATAITPQHSNQQASAHTATSPKK